MILTDNANNMAISLGTQSFKIAYLLYLVQKGIYHRICGHREGKNDKPSWYKDSLTQDKHDNKRY
jgi:hypothetical protein